jgi:hypothetical protein
MLFSHDFEYIKKGVAMNTKRYNPTLAIIFSFALLFSFLSSSVAQQTRVIRLQGSASNSQNGVRIEPDTMLISKGGVVIWNNWARSSDVKIIFQEGKVCQDVTSAPMGFTLDAKQCYVTTWIPFGGTSSLRFTEKGNYHYVVEAAGGAKSKGAIRVD